MLTPSQYLKVLGLGFTLSPPPSVQGLCGRIIRGKTTEDFEKLSDDPNRLIVFLTDALGLAKMFGKSDYDMLITVGHHPDHIKKQLEAGKSYKFVVFPESEAQPATWDGLFKATGQVYPDIISDIQQHSAELIGTKYAAFEGQAGFKFASVDDVSNANYMSHAAYLASPRKAVDLRRLFYHTLHIRELYSGDGYTYDEKGKRGVKEYLMPNKKITDIHGAVVADMAVQLP